jgi:hypothetical protein
MIRTLSADNFRRLQEVIDALMGSALAVFVCTYSLKYPVRPVSRGYTLYVRTCVCTSSVCKCARCHVPLNMELHPSFCVAFFIILGI